MTNLSVRKAFRTLLLPTRLDRETACCEAFELHLKIVGIKPDDAVVWVRLRLQEWEGLGHPSEKLNSVVKTVLLANATSGERSEIAGLLAANYFAIHRKLIDDQLMTHHEAIAFLTHVFVLCDLSELHNLSTAKIVEILAEQPLLADFGRQAIECVLSTLKAVREVSLTQIQNLFDDDASREGEALADANLLEAAEAVAIEADSLGVKSGLFGALRILLPDIQNDGQLSSFFTPYLQILHFQCSLAEFVDHDLTDIYEFSPRGKKGEWLHKCYPDSISGAGNPFLNNAKSVESLNRGWARSKKPKERPGALALITVLNGLKSLNFLARRELAFWVRMWLHRIIRIAGDAPISLPMTLTANQAATLLKGMASSNTQTFGIIEQRVVDAIAVIQHPKQRTRGVGDSVNASNWAKGKFGDCEFLDTSQTLITAYEAHAGELSQLYIDEHIAGLRKSLPKRINELNAIADLSEWKLVIIFVAHSLAGSLSKALMIDRLKVSIKPICFADFLNPEHMPSTNQVQQSLAQNLLMPLNQHRTPNKVRTRLIDLMTVPSR